MGLDNFEIYWRMICVGYWRILVSNFLGLFCWSFHILPPTAFCVESRNKASALEESRRGSTFSIQWVLSLYPLVFSQDSSPQLCLVPLSPETSVLPSWENELSVFRQGRKEPVWNAEGDLGIEVLSKQLSTNPPYLAPAPCCPGFQRFLLL